MRVSLIWAGLLAACCGVVPMPAQTPQSGGGLALAPSEPISSLEPQMANARAAAAGLNAPSKVRSAKLELKPPGDAVYLVEESAWDGGQWRTFRRPKVDAFSKNVDGVGIHGYDLISYLEGHAEKGRKEFQVERDGVTWWFVNADHRRQFLADPERFSPQYGGFCAYSIGRGYPVSADPRIFAVSGGRLYLFFDPAVKTVWEQEQRNSTERADRNWPNLVLANPAQRKRQPE